MYVLDTNGLASDAPGITELIKLLLQRLTNFIPVL